MFIHLAQSGELPEDIEEQAHQLQFITLDMTEPGELLELAQQTLFQGLVMQILGRWNENPIVKGL